MNQRIQQGDTVRVIATGEIVKVVGISRLGDYLDLVNYDEETTQLHVLDVIPAPDKEMRPKRPPLAAGVGVILLMAFLQDY